MIVRCKSKSGLRLPIEYLDSRAGLTTGTDFPLAVGKDYVVYAVALRDAQVWLYLADEDALYYPRSYPAPLFEVLDSRVSKYWHFRHTPAHLDHSFLLAIPEWCADAYFYDRLTDGAQLEYDVFWAAKRRMDDEVSETAAVDLRRDEFGPNRTSNSSFGE